MIVIFIAAFFCVLNISLWGAFFIKFKKIFSTDDIIESTREEMNRMIADINSNAGRNIELIEDRLQQLKIVIAEADRHIELAKREIDMQNSKISYQNKIDSAIQGKKNVAVSSKSGSTNRAVREYMKNQGISAGLNGAKRYELTEEGNNQVKAQEAGELFTQADLDASRQIISPSGTTFTVESDGSSYASVPVIGGNVTYAESPIEPKKSFAELARDLNQAGHSIEEIARELNRSTTEVEMALFMNL